MKPTLVLIHGWGQSAQVWHSQAEAFSERWPVQVVNLPGCGGTPDAPASVWVNMLCDMLPDRPCILIGWSLGGMLAVQLAYRHPDRIAGLVLVSATPCFRLRRDWEYGCPDARFSEFKQALHADSVKLLGHFFALTLHGDALSSSRYNAIAKAAVDRRHPPSPQALEGGLQLLDRLDLRPVLADIPVPTLVMHGERDAIVPVEAGRHLAQRIPDAHLHILPCGHAPHLTRKEDFNNKVERWCLNIISTCSG